MGRRLGEALGLSCCRVLAWLAAHGIHVYLSTGCLHGEHGYCAAMTGWQGAKRPAECKFCSSRCVCRRCHRTLR